jgi:hypothetical protein
MKLAEGDRRGCNTGAFRHRRLLTESNRNRVASSLSTGASYGVTQEAGLVAIDGISYGVKPKSRASLLSIGDLRIS